MKNKRGKSQYVWVVRVTVLTFVLAGVFNFLSLSLMERVNLFWAVMTLLAVIFIGVMFDIVGIAVASADEAPFHSMAAKGVRGAARAIRLIRNSEKVLNFCGDVIGDIAGILSGSLAAVIAMLLLLFDMGIQSVVVSIAVTSMVAALTVGGKAVGKSIAIRYAKNIVYFVARMISFE